MSLLRSLESPQHARLRFLGTIVKTQKDIPVVITNIDDGWGVRCYSLNSLEAIFIDDIRAGEIVPDPVKLGFCQIGKESFYLSRKPARRTKQGLDVNELNVFSPLNVPIGDLQSNASYKALARAILGDYASFETALKSIRRKEIKSLAFSRNWSLVSAKGNPEEIGVFYKFYGKCGVLTGDMITLDNKFASLRETLEEEVGNVCA